jgi:hypothetical protein
MSRPRSPRLRVQKLPILAAEKASELRARRAECIGSKGVSAGGDTLLILATRTSRNALYHTGFWRFGLSCGVMVCGGGMLGLPTVPDLIEAPRENLATAKDKGLPCSACAPTSGE